MIPIEHIDRFDIRPVSPMADDKGYYQDHCPAPVCIRVRRPPAKGYVWRRVYVDKDGLYYVRLDYENVYMNDHAQLAVQGYVVGNDVS